MKNKIDLNKGPRTTWSLYALMTYMFISLCMIIGIQAPVHAQEIQYERPSWRFGVVGGANFNFYQGTTQKLDSERMTPQAFGHGDGMGLFVAPVIEYHKPGTVFGFILQAGYDSRKGAWDQVLTPCNCPADLSTELLYITVEPSIRMAPFSSNFFIFAGPRIAFLHDKTYNYEQGINPDYPNSSVAVSKSGDFSDMNKTQISMQVGAGLDIPISSTSSQTQFMMSPFVSYHPYFGQTPRTVETWNITTIRAGLAIKFGKGKRIKTPVAIVIPAIPSPIVTFTANSPRNVPVNQIFIESFPLRNYVFFDQGATSIPSRYVVLNTTQANTFKDNQIARLNQSTSDGRSARQLTVYYNILNILGDRMVKNPSSNITLVGSSDQNAQHATARAEAVKSYLVTVFGVNASRINTRGLNNSSASRRASGTEVGLLSQEDNRVAIETSSSALLAAYMTNPKPTSSPSAEAPADSYVTFNVDNATNLFSSWRLELKGTDGKTQNFGPYKNASVSIPGALILGDQSNGTYKAMMIGTTPGGDVINRETSVNVVKWEPQIVEYGTRFSVIYEFDSSTATTIQESYLKDVVLPSISNGATVRIYGFTDTIGDQAYNLKLSTARANDVRTIIQRNLSSSGKTNVKFDTDGKGQESSLSPFKNTHPEERYYNRTVLIEVIPSK